LIDTAEEIAAETGVSPRTVKRDAALVRELEDKSPGAVDAVIQGKAKLADVKREIVRADQKKRLENVEAVEAKEARGEYDVLVIDPPWPMKKIDYDVRPLQTGFDYPTMSVDDIASLAWYPGRKLPAASDCHVFMWTTQKFLPPAFRVMHEWGVRYVCTFVWHKPNGIQPIGLPKYNCEFALYGRIGSPKFVDAKAFWACFEAPTTGHSIKPIEFYDLVRRVTAGRRLDIFNRREIEGFDGWGNESDG